MPIAQIPNANQAFGRTDAGSLGNQVLLEVVNNAATTLTHGDVVVVDVTGRLVTTTTTANDPTVLGVISTTGDTTTDAVAIPIGAPCWVCTGGVARVQIGTQTVAALGVMGSFTTAKQADDTATVIGTGFGIALEASAAKDVNNTIRCIIDKV